MSFINQYLEFLERLYTSDTRSHFPVQVKIPEADTEKHNLKAVEQIKKISSLLNAKGVALSTVGSTSLQLQLGMGSPHDIDFVVSQKDINTVQNALVETDYDFWREDFIHRNVRRMTGGMGRHHNYSIATPDFLQRNGLPVWMGIFTYEKIGDGISFYEVFAISEYKIRLLFSRLKQERQDIPEDILAIQANLSSEGLISVIEELSKYGVDFWTAINSPDLNSVDIQRMNYIMSLGNEHSSEDFFEFIMTTWYGLSPEDYLFSSNIKVQGEILFSIPLEISYLRFTDPRFYPHFLGQREKYKVSAALIEKSGRLDQTLLKRVRQIYEDQRRSYKTLGKYTFTHEATLDPQILRRQMEEGMHARRGEPNYLPFILEGTHYVIM